MANFCLQFKLGTQRVFILEPLARRQHVLATGVPSIILWTPCGSVWQENSFHVGIIRSDSVLLGTLVCKRSVFAIPSDLGHKHHCLDEKTLDVLRGLQGLGAAATIPSAVSCPHCIATIRVGG